MKVRPLAWLTRRVKVGIGETGFLPVGFDDDDA